MVTKEQLDAALKAWEVARDKALLEQQAWSTLTGSHSDLIASLRKHGHTWAQAEAEFGKFSNAHSDAIQSAWRDMDEKCRHYQELHAKFLAQ